MKFHTIQKRIIIPQRLGNFYPFTAYARMAYEEMSKTTFLGNSKDRVRTTGTGLILNFVLGVTHVCTLFIFFCTQSPHKIIERQTGVANDMTAANILVS